VYITKTSGDDSSATATVDNKDEHRGKLTSAVFLAALLQVAWAALWLSNERL
jgi:hypothetical protein